MSTAVHAPPSARRGAADALAAEYLAAVSTGDRRTAFGVVDRALAGGMDVRGLYLDVFQPALVEIGRLWQRNAITVADEHLATAITQAAMARLYERLFQSATGDGPLLVAACVDSERHDVGLRMLCDILELDGWDTVYLGSAVPMDHLVRMVCQRHPDAVALSASLAPHLGRVEETVRAIRAACGTRQPVIAVGGRPFAADPELAARVGADLTADDADEAARRLNERFAR